MADKVLTAEAWTVVIGNEDYENERHIYHVVSNSAGQAEKKGLKLAKGDDVENPYCRCATFEFNLFL